MVKAFLRNFRTCHQVIFQRQIHRNHYDTLQLSPKASNQEIKQAYYKLSLKYHPDKLEGNADKFREISAAYEVLGNIKLRRMYDNGFLAGQVQAPGSTSDTREYDENLQKAAERFKRARSRSEEAGGRINIDYTHYDEWTKQHYSKTMYRDKRRRELFKRHEHYHKSTSGDSQYLRIVVGFFAFVGLIVALRGGNRWDNPPTPSKKSES